MNFKHDSKFDKDFKKLGKKYRNLAKDLDLFRRIHGYLHEAETDQNFVRNFFASKNATILRDSHAGQRKIIKARLNSRDSNSRNLRIIYGCDLENNLITFIEIYAKNNKSREDIRRWRSYLNS